ncbi:hypothetical protein PSHT_15670 [Puccinia striiformis]|uniref:Uncharacterized protein n=1 Tax=Puccinia striiformis TaxID=27350 RepID=A0A2S4UDL0_9BASI|nr:hypothetical protein PSHT_15670 [Puccinia striiformis]
MNINNQLRGIIDLDGHFLNLQSAQMVLVTLRRDGLGYDHNPAHGWNAMLNHPSAQESFDS